MAEQEEAMRMLIVLSQAVLPLARDCVKMLARATARAGIAGAGVAGRARRAVTDRIDFRGDAGIVNARRLRGKELSFVQLDGALDRPDLHELADACRRLGVGFTVLTDGSGRSTLCFRTRDAETMNWATHQLLGAYRIEGEEAVEVLDAPRLPSAGEALERGLEAKPFEHDGLTWSPDREGRVAEGSSWSCELDRPGGGRARLTVGLGGRWAITDEHAEPIRAHDGTPLAGRATTMLEACTMAKAYSAHATDAALVAADRRAGYATPQRAAASMTAGKVAREAGRSATALRRAAQGQRQAPAHPRAQVRR